MQSKKDNQFFIICLIGMVLAVILVNFEGCKTKDPPPLQPEALYYESHTSCDEEIKKLKEDLAFYKRYFDDFLEYELGPEGLIAFNAWRSWQ